MKYSCLLVLFAFVFINVNAQTFDDFISRVNSAPEVERTAIVDSFMAANPIFPLIEYDTLTHFLYRGTASSVTVPGDANGWTASSFPMTKLSTTNLWYHTRTFESDARLDYKLVLNGSNWILDPRNPHQVSGGFGPNSELRMPSYVTAPEIQYYPGIPHGTLRDTIFFSSSLGNSRTIRVYTPPGYGSPLDSFPVVIVHDGLEYVTLAQMNNVLDFLISQGRIQKTIAVFVPPVNRTDEYAGNQINQFTTFIVNELMPYIDSRYRTQRSPAHRATLGASNGGNIALWLGYSHPETFGNIAAYSSNIVNAISNGFQNSPLLDLKLYLDLGTYDIPQLIPLVRNFIPILQSKGYPHQYVEYHEGHSWGNWRAHIDNALEYFLPGPALSVGEPITQPKEFELFQNYPNPGNPGTEIGFQIVDFGFVTLKVFDILGRGVTTLVNQEVSSGSHTVSWDGINASGKPVSSGVYFYRLDAVGQNGKRTMSTKKMLLMR